MSLQLAHAAELQVSETAIAKIDCLFEVYSRIGDDEKIMVDATTFSEHSEGVKDLAKIVEIAPEELAGKWLVFYL